MAPAPTLHTFQVGFSTNQKNEISLLDLAFHPHRPTLRRRRHKLIDRCVDAPVAEANRQAKHLFGVFVRVVAVADEGFGRSMFSEAALSAAAGIADHCCKQITFNCFPPRFQLPTATPITHYPKPMARPCYRENGKSCLCRNTGRQPIHSFHGCRFVRKVL